MIYVCHTVYHLLVALNIQDDNKLLLLDDRINRVFDYKVKIEEQLKLKVYIFNDRKIYNNNVDLVLNRSDFQFKEMIKNNRIILFNDLTYFGFYLIKNKFKYVLFEDGLDCYKSKLKFPTNFKIKLKNKIKGIPTQMGESKYCIEININDKKGLENDFRYEKFVENPRYKFMENVGNSRLEILFKIFDVNKVSIKENSVLIITQPLFFDGFFESLDQHQAFYSKSIYEFESQGMQVYIKEHPRDRFDYTKISENILFLNKNVPMELLDYVVSRKFKIAFTHSSTVINTLKMVEEKIIFLK